MKWLLVVAAFFVGTRAFAGRTTGDLPAQSEAGSLEVNDCQHACNRSSSRKAFVRDLVQEASLDDKIMRTNDAVPARFEPGESRTTEDKK